MKKIIISTVVLVMIVIFSRQRALTKEQNQSWNEMSNYNNPVLLNQSTYYKDNNGICDYFKQEETCPYSINNICLYHHQSICEQNENCTNQQKQNTIRKHRNSSMKGKLHH